MKKLWPLIVLLLIISLLAVGCGDEEEPATLLGAWRHTGAEESADMIYCFAECGHMLTLEQKDGEILRAVTAHYVYEDGYLSIYERGETAGALGVAFSGNQQLQLSLVDDDGKPVVDSNTGQEQGLLFTREQTTSTPFLGNWATSFKESNDTYIRQYAFEENGVAAMAVRDSFGSLVDYRQLGYMYNEENGTLRIYEETEKGTVVDDQIFIVAFPYEGYMTAEAFDAQVEDEISEILVFVRVEEASDAD